MNTTVSISRRFLIVATFAAPAQVCLAQAQQQGQQPREDNRWGGLSHQPTEGEVQQQEQAAGIARPQQQQKAVNQDVEQMYQNLMKSTAPGSAAPQ